MDKRVKKLFDSQTGLGNKVPPYGLIYLDHLHSEYLALKGTIDPDSVSLLEGIYEKRGALQSPPESANPLLTWDDIYAFDLELLKHLPPAALLRKAYDMRVKYRGVAGRKEYDAYMATKPPDLAAVGFTCAIASPPTPAALEAASETALREDIKYLMSVFYLNHALLPLREGLRDELTRKAWRWTLLAILISVLFVALNFAGNGYPGLTFYRFTRGSTIWVVVMAGVMGGLVSLLQRIQSAPRGGDALFNLASLTYGWSGLFLAPLSGGIFASLMFILFAGGVLRGSIFPEIYTPMPAAPSSVKPAPTPMRSPIPAGSPSALPSATPSSTPAGEGSSAREPADTPEPATPAEGTPASDETLERAATAPATQTPTPTATQAGGAERRSVSFSRFLRETGPASGVSYALLIVWCFVAGFAERLVPDMLNRMLSKNLPPNGNAGD